MKLVKNKKIYNKGEIRKLFQCIYIYNGEIDDRS